VGVPDTGPEEVVDRADGGGEGRRGRLAAVETFSVVVVLRFDAAIGDGEIPGLLGGTDDEGSLVWRDGADPRVMRLSSERAAEDLSDAVQQGRGLAAEALDRFAVPGEVLEVVAMADEDSMVWRAEP
jgi:hypothetical protein